MKYFFLTFLLLVPQTALASDKSSILPSMLSNSWAISALIVFCFAYALVPFENVIHLKKSKPVLLAAGLIWLFAALAFSGTPHSEQVGQLLEHALFEYVELFLFLLTAMTYINALEERNVFRMLKALLISQKLSFPKIYWTTGLLAFFISPVADNLTTALVMGAVVMAVAGKNTNFIALACVNIVVASNAGGAFSPFGDITTLMVWQKEHLKFFEFFALFLPALINWFVPALIISFYIPKGMPEDIKTTVKLKYGAKTMIALFLSTILTAVFFHSYLHLSPAVGMMFGLGYLGIFSYYLQIYEGRHPQNTGLLGNVTHEFNPRIRHIQNEQTAISQLVDENVFPAFAIDKEHRVTHWNSGLETLTGIAAKDMLGSCEPWTAFYAFKRAVLADLVLDQVSEKECAYLYEGNMQRNVDFDSGLDGVGFYPNLGKTGKWLAFSAIPVFNDQNEIDGAVEILSEVNEHQHEKARFDIMRSVAGAEWDTLLFFYGIILSVSGLSVFGYLDFVSLKLYGELSPELANTCVGILSAVLDNIPVMLAVLTMEPEMNQTQWLLVTLTAGVGGSLFAIGSAAGVALLGAARGSYTFMSHLKWTPAIFLGYILSILAHLYLNSN